MRVSDEEIAVCRNLRLIGSIYKVRGGGGGGGGGMRAKRQKQEERGSEVNGVETEVVSIEAKAAEMERAVLGMIALRGS